MAVASLVEQKGGLTPSALVQAHRMNFIVLEIDPDVFEMENNSRMVRGRGDEPLDELEWQFDGFVLSLGFKQECIDCKYVGDREEFNKDKAPPYKCPNCSSKNVIRTMKPERAEFPEFVAQRAVMENRVYPNKRDTEGRILVDKDNTQQSIPLLRIVSRIDGKTREETTGGQKKPRCSFCGAEFQTLTLLQKHRVDVHFKDHPAVAPKLEGMTASKALETLAIAAKQQNGQQPAPAPVSAPIAPELAHERAAEPESEPKRVSASAKKAAQKKLEESKAKQDDAATPTSDDY